METRFHFSRLLIPTVFISDIIIQEGQGLRDHIRETSQWKTNHRTSDLVARLRPVDFHNSIATVITNATFHSFSTAAHIDASAFNIIPVSLIYLNSASHDPASGTETRSDGATRVGDQEG